PRPRVHLRLDAQHRPQVAPAHRDEVDLEVLVGLLLDPGGHQSEPPVCCRRPSSAISASDLRRYIASSSHGCTNSSRSARGWASSTSAAADGYAFPTGPTSRLARSANVDAYRSAPSPTSRASSPRASRSDDRSAGEHTR